MALPEVGDLAFVKPTTCCGYTKHVGRIGKVEAIKTLASFCGGCKKNKLVPLGILNGSCYYELAQLQRIPPLGDLESLSDSHDIPVKHKEPA